MNNQSKREELLQSVMEESNCTRACAEDFLEGYAEIPNGEQERIHDEAVESLVNEYGCTREEAEQSLKEVNQ
jgi:hypothetical protein